MKRAVWLASLFLCAAGPPARVVVVKLDGVYAVRGGERVKLPVDRARGPIVGGGVTMNADGSAVASVDWNCGGGSDLTFSRGVIESRLENAAALKLHKKRQFAEAAAGFARAVAADPTWDLAATNLAAAQAMAGDRAGAIATLVAAARRNPAWTVHRLVADPELSGLADAAELAPILAGDGTATADGLGFAYSEKLGLIAWGGDSVTIVDGTGAVRATLPLGRGESEEWKPSRALAAQATRALQALGFKPLPKTSVVELSYNYAAKSTAVFPGTRIGLVARDGVVRAVTGDKVLAEGAVLHTESAALLPDHRIIVISELPVSEDCGDGGQTMATLLKLP